VPIENSSLYKIAHSDSDAKLGSCCAAICDGFNTMRGGRPETRKITPLTDAPQHELIAVSNFIQTRLGHRASLITSSTFSYGGGKSPSLYLVRRDVITGDSHDCRLYPDGIGRRAA
jgi:hypothetical protein